MTCWAKLRIELDKTLKGAPLEDNIVVLGSGAMQLNGIDRKVADIDLFARRWVWDAMLTRGWTLRDDLDPPPMLEWNGCAVPVHCWYETYTRFIDNDSSPQTTFERATVVNGWPCMDLAQLQAWKLEANRPKDRADVDLLAAHFAAKSQLESAS